MPVSEELRTALISAVARSGSPGAVAYVGDRTRTVLHEAHGYAQVTPSKRRASKDTPYDLASLTKVVATTSAIMLLRDDGVMDLDQPVFEFVPVPAFSRFTLRDCLTHTAGLVPGMPYYKDCASVEEMLQRYAERALESPPGARYCYSDVGFLILGKVVELAARDSLDAFCRKRIFHPLGMTRTRFRPPEAWAQTCAATEDCTWRQRVLVGAVHDENAYAVGGVAGHAGLFSTAQDLARFCRALLNETLLSRRTLDEMTRAGMVAHYPWQGLGWKLDPWACGIDGSLPSRAALGHSGWTGTSLWLDRATGLFTILLANTCHPSRKRRDNRTLRRTFHHAVSQTFYPHRSNTHTGLDRLVREQFERVRGKRVAVLTNHAAVDQLRRPLLDVLALEPSVDLRVVYSPEHGVRGQAEAGETVPSQPGEVPVISLYGKRRFPSPHELAEVDLFLVDLQDIGARYYTYMATMRDCMAACAKTGTSVLVLDRPNPLGGEILEGPIATETGSETCCAPIPIRHGMTLGELATFFARTSLRRSNLQLTISALDAWPRQRLFAECALPWVPPSPNMPTAETALLYVGTCLFEGTNLNEGRGTPTPFQVVGAPWLDAQAVIEGIAPEEQPGCRLEPVTYTPRSIPGKAANPRYCGKACRGIRIEIKDPGEVRAFTVAVALLAAIQQVHADTFLWEEGFDILAGTPTLRAAIAHGHSATQIVDRCEDPLKAFDRRRPRLYPS